MWAAISPGDPSRRRTRLPQLLRRVVEQRRRGGLDTTPPASAPVQPQAEGHLDTAQRIAALEQRMQDLENLIEGFQDSVHRTSTRLEAKLRELDQKSEPLEIRRALDRDARERGV